MLHSPEMPLNRPRIRFLPMSAKTVDGELMPKRALTALMMERKKFLTLPMSQPIAPVIPFHSPRKMSLPIASILPGRSLINILKFWAMVLATVETFPARAFRPFVKPVMIVLPRFIQLKAVKTSHMAPMIFGIFWTMVGMACTRPFARVHMIFAAAARSLGALSLMIPAILLMMVGTCCTMVGMLSASPCARFLARLMAPSTILPAFSRRLADRPITKSRPISIREGRLSFK